MSLAQRNDTTRDRAPASNQVLLGYAWSRIAYRPESVRIRCPIGLVRCGPSFVPRPNSRSQSVKLCYHSRSVPLPPSRRGAAPSLLVSLIPTAAREPTAHPVVSFTFSPDDRAGRFSPLWAGIARGDRRRKISVETTGPTRRRCPGLGLGSGFGVWVWVSFLQKGHQFVDMYALMRMLGSAGRTIVFQSQC